MSADHGQDSSEVEVAKTVCNMCTNHCGINVYVQNEKILNVEGMPEHPFHRLCIKPSAIPELVHSDERLTNPLRKVNGKFKEISWDEAFRFIADKLSAIKKEYGAKAVDIHTGNPFIATQTEKVIRRFADLYGTPNYTSGGGYCFLAKVIGHCLTVGALIAPYVSQDTKCMLIWGKNPPETFASEIDVINANIRNGAKLIVIDPRATPLARRADLYAQVRPGTDGALALGLLNVVITEGLYDEGFVKEWTVGFDKLVEVVREYSPKKVEEIAWVPAATIENIARTYATTRPACTSLGVSMDHSSNGIQAIRAISALIAITGNLDVPGGSVTALPGVAQTNLRLEEMVEKDRPIGADYPLFTEYSLETTVLPLIDAMVTQKPYPLKALLLVGCNPVVTWPNANKLKKAFENLDLLVVVDIFMTDTARMADIVLPGTTALEREDLRDAYHTHEALSLFVKTDRAIEPIGHAMEDWKIWAELGKRMGYAEHFPWRDTNELMRELLEPTNIELEQLKQNPGGVVYREKRFRQYVEEGFNTPSKKVELYSETMAQFGHDPVPTFREPIESPTSQPDLAGEYPLILATGARSRFYTHSEYRNISALRRLWPEPFIEINPRTAKGFGIAEGDLVMVESPRGSIRIKAKLTEDVHPRVVSIQMGWSEANANLLTDDQSRDPVSGFPELRALLCRVVKA